MNLTKLCVRLSDTVQRFSNSRSAARHVEHVSTVVDR